MRNAERSLYCCRFACRQLCFNIPIGLRVKNTKHENDSYKLISQFESQSIRPNSNCHR